MSEWTLDTLKEHYDKVFADRDIAIRLAVTELERRLEILNNSHEIARQKEHDFYSRDAHEVFARTVSSEMSVLRDQITAIQRPQWPLWISAFMAVMAITGALWFLAVSPIREGITRLDDQVREHSKQMDALPSSKHR